MNSKFYFRLIVFTLLGLVNAQWAAAQNVTISPQNGSMIAALTASSSTTQYGYRIGAFATWRHNQLSLTMTASNDPDLTEDKQLANHANHFITGDKCTYSPDDDTRNASKYIVTGWGGSNVNTGYITIALPKGYRFTGYTFHLSHDVATFGENNSSFDLTTDTEVSLIQTDEHFEDKRSVTLSGSSAKVEEFSYTGNEFGNILYFKTTAPSDGFYAMTFRYIELTFTADADTEVSVLPSSQEFTGKSMLEVPFNTGKVDLGEIQRNRENIGSTWWPNYVWRYSYEYDKVTDMSANMLLYEKESTRTAQDGEVLDGTAGLVAYDKGGSITTNGSNFKFTPTEKDRNDDGKVDDEDMQIYYLETPVSATMSNGEKNPVQFRITEATIYYTKISSDAFYIKYIDGDTPYYLGTDNGQFKTSPTSWSMDDDGHIFSGSDYLTVNNSWAETTRTKNAATTFTIEGGIIKDASGNTLKYISYNYNGNRYRYGYFTNAETLGDGYNSYNVYPAEVEAMETSTSTVPDYTIYVYDKEGNTKQTIPVKGNGFVKLEDLNNDAIMFGVQGGKVALLNFSLKLQALNPYIDQMTVVLNDQWKGKDIRMTRTFTADDFSVGGGTFRFYLPTDCVDDRLTITFEDLYSKYGDDTYDHTKNAGTSSSRYNFVMSQHHQNFTGDNIYNDREEAASGTLESDRIEAKENIRTQVGTVGNIAFRFNNADELATNNGYLTEYPFTVAKYAAQTGKVVQDGVETTANGNFITAEFEPSKVQVALHDKTFYVFTTDETRYNIAPTTATQHRFYAFYAMKVEVVCQDYSPIITFEKVYDKTVTESNVNDQNTAFYGVKVTAPAGIDAPLASDVATYKAICEAMEAGGDVPADLTNILYVDMSKLNGVYHSKPMKTEDAKYTLENFDGLREKLAPNALIFLPANSTATFDNFAYAKKGEVAGSFQSANNIILTDKSPFYTPYTIQVDAANYATYKRLRTAASEDLVEKATVVLPFTMKVENGTHKNDTEDGFEFKLRYLKKLTAQSGTDQYGTDGVDEGTGNFVLIEGTETQANYPYMVEVISANGSDYSFIAAQKGSNIVATPETITGETAAGLTNTGTYSGVKLPTTKSFYYFTKNKYVASKTAKERYNEIYVQPFRAYYVDPTATSKLSMFEIVYDEFADNEGLITGITDVRTRGPLSVVTGHGNMMLTSTEDINVTVCNIKGTVVANLKMSAGEQQNINVPAGVYLVNKKKVIVK